VSRAPLDRPIPVTFFRSYAATTKGEARNTPRELAEHIRTTTAETKAELPWLKLARFGDKRTDKGSLRSNDNVLAISGVEADYDQELITFDEALETLTGQGVASVLYTSPSHTEDSPRWRVLCPLSGEQPPDQRRHMLGRLNGLFRGIFSHESWVLSQSYYFGSVRNNPSHRVELIEGLPIDRHGDLDEARIGPGTFPAVCGPDVGRSGCGAGEPRRTLPNALFEAVYARALRRVSEAPKGEMHWCVLRQARVIGGIAERAGISKAEAVRRIVEALPPEEQDAGAYKAAEFGFDKGLRQPLQFRDRR
jgi:hypothetical protein